MEKIDEILLASLVITNSNKDSIIAERWQRCHRSAMTAWPGYVCWKIYYLSPPRVN